jgi:DNA-binding ferritin-like protein
VKILKNYQKFQAAGQIYTKRLDTLSAKILTKAKELADALNSSSDTQSDVYSAIIKIIEKHVFMIQKN